jgi:DNA-binding IclR family transcriptional regulator
MVNSVLHATQILELYASQKVEYLSLTEISRALHMHKTTVYRILQTLQSVGWIEQSEVTSQYKLGSGMLLVASAVSVHLTTRNIILGEMQKLSVLYNETVVLSALRGSIGLAIDMVKSRQSLAVDPSNGYIVPLDLGASGKVLLAAQTPETIKNILQEYPPEKRVVMEETTRKIQRTGYCYSEAEVDPGVAAVAVPLSSTDYNYALTLSGPIERIRAFGIDRLTESLQITAENIKMKTSIR